MDEKLSQRCVFPYDRIIFQQQQSITPHFPLYQSYIKVSGLSAWRDWSIIIATFLDGMLVHRYPPAFFSARGFPREFTCTHLYSWVERSTMRAKFLAQEHNTMTAANAQTQIARSRIYMVCPQYNIVSHSAFTDQEIIFLIQKSFPSCRGLRIWFI